MIRELYEKKTTLIIEKKDYIYMKLYIKLFFQLKKQKKTRFIYKKIKKNNDKI